MKFDELLWLGTNHNEIKFVNRIPISKYGSLYAVVIVNGQ